MDKLGDGMARIVDSLLGDGVRSAINTSIDSIIPPTNRKTYGVEADGLHGLEVVRRVPVFPVINQNLVASRT